MILIERGSLWEHVVRTTEQARASGALLPVPTDAAYIAEGPVRFFVRVLSTLRRKDEARKAQQQAAQAGKPSNPFLPPERKLTVGDITGSHIAVLNKFNVVDHHLLIVTRRFEEQEELLTAADFEALWLCMSEYDSLGFYNGGPEGGASQRHKHLQVVPLPLSPEGPPVPMQPFFDKAALDEEGYGTIPAFPFRHAFVRFSRIPATASLPDAARHLAGCYEQLLSRAGMLPTAADTHARQPLPYCLLVTRTWMLLVPRSREHFEDISFNSLAFAGSFFVRDAGQLARLRAYGPLRALRDVSFPR